MRQACVSLPQPWDLNKAKSFCEQQNRQVLLQVIKVGLELKRIQKRYLPAWLYSRSHSNGPTIQCHRAARVYKICASSIDCRVYLSNWC